MATIDLFEQSTQKKNLQQYEQSHDLVILQHVNTHLNVAKTTRKHLKYLVLFQPLYSPDTASSNYRLFQSILCGLVETQGWKLEAAN